MNKMERYKIADKFMNWGWLGLATSLLIICGSALSNRSLESKVKLIQQIKKDNPILNVENIKKPYEEKLGSGKTVGFYGRIGLISSVLSVATGGFLYRGQ